MVNIDFIDLKMQNCVKCKVEFEVFSMKNGKPSNKCMECYEKECEMNYKNWVNYKVYKTKCKRKNTLLMISKRTFQELIVNNWLYM